MEHFASLLFVAGSVVIGLALLVFVAGGVSGFMLWGLFDVEFFDIDALALERLLKLVEVVAEQSGGLVIGGGEGRGDYAVADLHGDLEGAEFGRVEANAHGSAAGEEVGAYFGDDVGMIGLSEGGIGWRLWGCGGRGWRRIDLSANLGVCAAEGCWEFIDSEWRFFGLCGLLRPGGIGIGGVLGGGGACGLGRVGLWIGG